ncbi:hypothetical protein [Breznakiella homolactica]|uniref:Integrase catalytic domain-containing protein n=1 Tax=Breznakiella homolactica TaxID=2798577 RepID=A0A7T7XR76_9SPIR|nr:hypothetical protein [Breznakiella homolactica]QQO11009.1 hypothetical protein JFL75_08855 [Breznakiella homolactica]
MEDFDSAGSSSLTVSMQDKMLSAEYGTDTTFPQSSSVCYAWNSITKTTTSNSRKNTSAFSKSSTRSTRKKHIQEDFTGHLVAIDSFMVDNLKGIGKINLQTVVDCHSRFAWGTPYTPKVPVMSVHVLNDKVLPFFEEHNCPVITILSDNV